MSVMLGRPCVALAELFGVQFVGVLLGTGDALVVEARKLGSLLPPHRVRHPGGPVLSIRFASGPLNHGRQRRGLNRVSFNRRRHTGGRNDNCRLRGWGWSVSLQQARRPAGSKKGDQGYG